MRMLSSTVLILAISTSTPFANAHANEPNALVTAQEAQTPRASWFSLSTLKSAAVLSAQIATVVAFYNPSLLASGLSFAMPYLSSMVAASPYFAFALTALKATEFLNPDSPKMILLARVLDVVGYGDHLRRIQRTRQSFNFLSAAAA